MCVCVSIRPKVLKVYQICHLGTPACSMDRLVYLLGSEGKGDSALFLNQSTLYLMLSASLSQAFEFGSPFELKLSKEQVPGK